MDNNLNENLPMFYAGQRVVAVDALPGNAFKNGTEYIVSGYEYKVNPVNGLSFWYIGIVGHHNGDVWFRPGIFTPIIEAFQAVSFEEIKEQEPVCTN